MLERRRHCRTRDFAVGTIAYGAPARTRAVMDCVVRNASEGGALLLVDEPRRAPVAMDLATRDGVRPARVVWRGETAVGVSFFAGAEPAATVPASASAAPSFPVVVDLDAARRRRAVGTDESRLAERIARFVRPSRRPDPA